MEIRLATAADSEQLVLIDMVAASDDTRRRQIEAWIEARCCHVVEIDVSLRAYGVLTYHFFGNGFIDMVTVGEPFRRQGLGSALIRYFRSICVTPKLFTSTNNSNHEMQNLLKAAGFQTSGIIENLDEDDPEIVFYSRIS